jgi:hypothetical protein
LISEERHAHSELVSQIDERIEVGVVTSGLQSADRFDAVDGAVVIEKQNVHRAALTAAIVVAHSTDDNVWNAVAIRVAEACHRRPEEVTIAQCD